MSVLLHLYSASLDSGFMLQAYYCYRLVLQYCQGVVMKFQVTVLPEASFALSRMHQVKLARRAARKALRMGSTAAIVIFPGPHGLRVTVNCQEATIVITRANENMRGVTKRNYRRSA